MSIFKEEELNKIKEAKEKWEAGPLNKALEKLKLTESPTKFYTPLDIKNFDFLNDVGFPGVPPYVPGRFPVNSIQTAWGKGSSTGAKTKAKRAGRYSGFGTPEDTRDYYIDVQEKGFRVGGPNLACDLPTQTGRDSDDEFAEGEVGKVGVAIDSLRDFEIIYEAFTGDMDLDKIASNWTVNGSSNFFIAMYAVLAEKRGIPLNKLQGTPQNDILKEYVARGTQIFPMKHSMRMQRDTMTFCTEHMPRFNITSISGFHMREFGATPAQTIVFTIANAIAYYKLGIDAGLDVDKFSRRMTWLGFGGGMEVLKELSARRAGRRVWAKTMRDVIGSKNPQNWIIRDLGGVLCGFWTATKQRPINNIMRSTISAVFSAMIGEPPVCSPAYDEPLGLGHSMEAQQIEEDGARIIMEEARLCDVYDPFAGSYYIESLTSQYEEEIMEILDKIDKMGGAVEAVDSGWMKTEIMRSSDEWRKKMEDGSAVQVGVNKYNDADEIEVTTPRTVQYDPEVRETVEARKIASLAELKKNRDNEKVNACVRRIRDAAEDESVNLLPLFIEAVREYATMGEIYDELRDVLGEAL